MLSSNSKSDHQLIENQQDLAKWVKNSSGPLDLAVAFWGEGVVEELGLEKPRPIRVLLELQSGGTNAAEVRRLMGLPHVEVKQFTRLHAKAYIANEGVVIGSTNASANGLGSEGSQSTSWHELAVRTTDASVVQDTKRWFKSKWSAGQPIKSRHLTQAELKWKERQKIRPKGVNKAKDILAAALGDPNNYRNRDLFVVVTTIPWDSEGNADATDYKEKTGHQALGWQEWPAIPKNATLICFTDYNGKDFQWDTPKSLLFTTQTISSQKFGLGDS